MDLNDITYKIRGAIFAIHKELGPGLLESVYEAALVYELQSQGLKVNTQVGIPVNYKEVRLELGFRMDLLAEDAIIIEVKSIEVLHDVHKNNYLHISDWQIKNWAFLSILILPYLKTKNRS